MRKNYEVWVHVKVHDKEALFEAAMKHAQEADGLPEDEALELLKPDGEIDTGACLTVIADPGSIPGCEIDQSGADPLPA